MKFWNLSLLLLPAKARDLLCIHWRLWASGNRGADLPDTGATQSVVLTVGLTSIFRNLGSIFVGCLRTALKFNGNNCQIVFGFIDILLRPNYNMCFYYDGLRNGEIKLWGGSFHFFRQRIKFIPLLWPSSLQNTLPLAETFSRNTSPSSINNSTQRPHSFYDTSNYPISHSISFPMYIPNLERLKSKQEVRLRVYGDCCCICDPCGVD